MKVGTDGVLLGAWATADNPLSILDIGAGSGLISIMLAQRFGNAMITGIEIDSQAADEARENVLKSPWSDRITIGCCDFCRWDTNTKFDLIVSNPPFFYKRYQIARYFTSFSPACGSTFTTINC